MCPHRNYVGVFHVHYPKHAKKKKEKGRKRESIEKEYVS
jgi:hypothetical protein